MIIHSSHRSIELEDDSISKKFLDAARDLTPEERGKLLQSDASFTEAHQELAVEGQTDANSDEPVNHHFIAFVNYKNELFELDGRKSYPVSHGPTNDDTFLLVITYREFYRYKIFKLVEKPNEHKKNQ